MNINKNILFTFISLILILCCLEASSRFVHIVYRSKIKSPSKIELSLFIKDPYLQFRNRPNYPFTSPDAENRIINSRGFRGKDFVRDPLKKLILCIGDSGTFGFGAKTGYPALLQKTLDSKGEKYQVINAGVSDYVSFQALIYYVKELVYLKPDIIIIYMGWNDIVVSNNKQWKSGSVLQLEDNSNSFLKNGNSVQNKLKNIMYKSVFIRGLRRLFSFIPRKTESKNINRVVVGVDTFSSQVLRDFTQNITNIINIAEAEGTEIYLCTLISQLDLIKADETEIFNNLGIQQKPYYKDFIFSNEQKINDQIRAIAEKAHVNLIDIQNCLKNDLTTADFCDYYHLVDSGYEKFVECASEKMNISTCSGK